MAYLAIPRLAGLSRMVVSQLFLVFLDLSTEFVNQRIDRGVHVAFDGIGMNRAAREVNGCLRFVFELFDGENAMDVGQVIEVTLQFGEL
jgi:hypothetical protein